MSVRLIAPSNAWLPLPKRFPTAAGEEEQQWEDRVIAGMREAWVGELDDVRERAARAALQLGLSRVMPDDSITLQYWPSASIVNAIVHVVAGRVAADDPRMVVPLGEGPFVVPPVTVKIENEKLGMGVEARYLTLAETEPPIEVGSLNYLFENTDSFVFVGIDQTFPALVGVMLEPLRDVVRSIEVLDDDGAGPWELCTVDESKLVKRGEEWNIGSPSESLV